MKITIYEKPTCSTCREVHKALKESGVKFDAVNYYVQPIPRSKLAELLKKMGIPAADLVRTKDEAYKQHVVGKNLSESQLIDLMSIHPDLIQRPIVENGDRAILARPAERLKEIL